MKLDSKQARCHWFLAIPPKKEKHRKNNTVKRVQMKWLLILGVALSPAFMPVLAPNASAATIISGNTADALVSNGVSQVSAGTIAAGMQDYYLGRTYVSVF